MAGWCTHGSSGQLSVASGQCVTRDRLTTSPPSGCGCRSSGFCASGFWLLDSVYDPALLPRWRLGVVESSASRDLSLRQLPRRHHLAGGRRGVRARHAGGGGRRGRDAARARLRAGRDPDARARRPRGAARRDWPDDRGRSRQGAARRARRGRPRRADVPGGGRGGPAHRRRGHPDGPRAARPGARGVHAALPDRPDRRHLAVQLPVQPDGPQAGARHRGGQPDRAEAGDQDAALGADPRRRARQGRPAEGRAQRPADVAADRRPPGHRRALQAADVHRLVGGRLGDEGARRQEEGAAGAGRQRRRHRRRDGRPRLRGEAHRRTAGSRWRDRAASRCSGCSSTRACSTGSRPRSARASRR